MLNGILSVAGRLFLVTIFLMSAVGNKIPNFEMISGYMASKGIPAPSLMLVGAILFLVVGSLTVLTGFMARLGAGMLLVFLALATFYFHAFWTISDPQAQQMEMIQAMKNMSIAGAMMFIIANGPGAWSLGRK